MAMTAEEIKNALEDSKSEKGWLKELCWQVAKLREDQPQKFDQTFHLPTVTLNNGNPLTQDPPSISPDGFELPRQKRKYTRRVPA